MDKQKCDKKETHNMVTQFGVIHLRLGALCQWKGFHYIIVNSTSKVLYDYNAKSKTIVTITTSEYLDQGLPLNLSSSSIPLFEQPPMLG